MNNQPTPTLAKEINTILDTLPDYLPDECATLNHNDLPEIKSALLKRFEAVMLEVIGGHVEPLWNDDEYDELWCQNCNRYQDNDGECWCKSKNDLQDVQRQRLTAVLSGEETV